MHHACNTRYQFDMILSAAELSAHGCLLSSGCAAGIQAVPLGNAILLCAESHTFEHCVLVPLYECWVISLCQYLGRHVLASSTSWHKLTPEVIATALAVNAPLASLTTALTTSQLPAARQPPPTSSWPGCPLPHCPHPQESWGRGCPPSLDCLLELVLLHAG